MIVACSWWKCKKERAKKDPKNNHKSSNNQPATSQPWLPYSKNEFWNDLESSKAKKKWESMKSCPSDNVFATKRNSPLLAPKQSQKHQQKQPFIAHYNINEKRTKNYIKRVSSLLPAWSQWWSMHVDDCCRSKNRIGTWDEVLDQGEKFLRETLHKKMYWLGDQTTHQVHDDCTSKQYDVENSEKNKELHLDEHVIVNSN